MDAGANVVNFPTSDSQLTYSLYTYQLAIVVHFGADDIIGDEVKNDV